MVGEIFDVVDADDNVVGAASREEAHRLGLLHRSVMFFIFDQAGRVFVNRRSKSKDVLPGKWSIVLGGHVDSGETYDEAVVREFQEETGLLSEPFAIDSFKKYIPEESEHVRVYGFAVDKAPHLDPSETICGEFMEVAAIRGILDTKDFLPETETLFKMLLKYIKRK